MENALNLSEVDAALAALAYLAVKHWIADFVLQTENQRNEKGVYGAMGGLTHAATHLAFTAPLFLLFSSMSPAVAVAVLAGEFVVHYHIDWAKEQVVRTKGWTAEDDQFWWAIGFDQLMHGLTYIAMVWFMLHATP